MRFPIAPSPTPILEGADRESCVTHGFEVTYEVEVAHEVEGKYEAPVSVSYEIEIEQKYERTPLDIGQLCRTPLSNNLWKLIYVAADEIESKDSGWGKITSTPGIYVPGKRFDAFYEVVVDKSYIPWLLDHNFQFLHKAEFEFLFRYKLYVPSTIHPLRVLGDGVYEVKKAFSDWKVGDGDKTLLRLGGIVTGYTSQKLEDVNECLSLPSPLAEDRLTTLLVDNDGSYEDQGTKHRLSSEVLGIVERMKVGQKVLIVREEGRGQEMRIWVVEVLQVLRVCSGHLSC